MGKASAPPAEQIVLAVNGGSSSIRFALYRIGREPVRMLTGKVDRIGSPAMYLDFQDPSHAREGGRVEATGAPAVGFLLDWLEQQIDFGTLRAVGHRMVHGLQHIDPQPLTPELLADLRRTIALDQDHLPLEIELVEEFGRRHPRLLQVACFDTAFHRGLPRVARILPIPRRFDALGVRRYGFHGLSYAFLMEGWRRSTQEAAQGRVILAHLGNGASMTAVREGRSIDTSMSFTPTAGLPMGTRPGDLDPGLGCYLSGRRPSHRRQFHRLINHDSGLLGVSETSSDMRELLAREADDVARRRGRGPVLLSNRKWIGGLAGALEGLDTLVFSRRHRRKRSPRSAPGFAPA